MLRLPPPPAGTPAAAASAAPGVGLALLPRLPLPPCRPRCAAPAARPASDHTGRPRLVPARATAEGGADEETVTAKTSAALAAATGGARTAQAGDIVAVHFTLRDEEGTTLDSSRERGEPITFEVGAGDVFANELYQAFDAVVRGLAVGESTTLEADGGEWDPGLLFTVPADHPEIERLAGRYKNVGGLAEGLVVELANGARAVVVKVVEGEAVTLDANDMLAGRRREFTLELVGIEAGRGGGAA